MPLGAKTRAGRALSARFHCKTGSPASGEQRFSAGTGQFQPKEDIRPAILSPLQRWTPQSQRLSSIVVYPQWFGESPTVFRHSLAEPLRIHYFIEVVELTHLSVLLDRRSPPAHLAKQVRGIRPRLYHDVASFEARNPPECQPHKVYFRLLRSTMPGTNKQ